MFPGFEVSSVVSGLLSATCHWWNYTELQRCTDHLGGFMQSLSVVYGTVLVRTQIFRLANNLTQKTLNDISFGTMKYVSCWEENVCIVAFLWAHSVLQTVRCAKVSLSETWASFSFWVPTFCVCWGKYSLAYFVKHCESVLMIPNCSL